MDRVMQSIANHINDYRYYNLCQPPPPPVKAIIVDHDRVHVYFYPIMRRPFADGIHRPIVNDFFIEWKDPKRSRWAGISTECDNLKGITFYLKHPKFKEKKTGLVDGHWHEYSFFHGLNQVYDIRVYAKNKSDDDIHPFTYTKLRLFEKAPSTHFEDILNTPPSMLNVLEDYLIGPEPKREWKKFPGHIARLCTYAREPNHVNPTSWVYYKPREGWVVDGYTFKDGEWQDVNLKNACEALIKNNQSDEVIFEILKLSHTPRFFWRYYVRERSKS